MTTTRKKYEWDLEDVDNDGDIIDHHHEDKLRDLKGDLSNININGLEDRVWAYVKDNEFARIFLQCSGE